MTSSIAVLVVLIALAVSSAWLTWRLYRANAPAARRIGFPVFGLATVLLAAVSLLAVAGSNKLSPRDFPVPEFKVAGTPEQIARGAHLASILCVACHSRTGDLPLAGGEMPVATALPVGPIHAPNLTPQGPLADWSDGELVRAIRQGTDRNGRPLLMPVRNLRNLGDDDVEALVAYLRIQSAVRTASQPAVGTADVRDQVPFPMLLLLGAGLYDISAQSIDGAIVPPFRRPDADYGEYVVGIMGCRECHGENLKGAGGSAAATPDLRVVRRWRAEQFVQTFRTGTDPSGRALGAAMPWRQLGRMDDTELNAVYQYFRSLPPG